MKNTDKNYIGRAAEAAARAKANKIQREAKQRAKTLQIQNKALQNGYRSFPKCECGKEAFWQGPRTGLRIFACAECYENHPNRQDI